MNKALFKRRRRPQVSGATVKSRRATAWVVLAVLVSGAVVAALFWWFGFRPDVAGAPLSLRQVEALKQQVAVLTEERDRLSALANAAESQINIEKATQQQLAEQVKVLLEENNRLQEDLAFFEKLLPANAGQRISIRRLSAELIAPNQLRYRLLIMQGGKNPSPFVGELQLAVMMAGEAGEADAMIIFPEENTAERQHFALNFRQYQRVEGVLTLPEGAEVTAVQARILEKGQIRVQQMVNL